MNNKNEVYLKLTSNVIIHFLKNYSIENNKIIFNEKDCSGYRSIRFSTEELDYVFKPVKKSIGYFKNGHFIYFEVKPEIDNWMLYLNISKLDLPYDLNIKLTNLNNISEDKNIVTLYKKDISNINANAQDIITNLGNILDNELDEIIENALKEKQNILLEDEDLLYNIKQQDIYIEGALEAIYNNKYERNQEARKKCIEHYGTTCQICGFDFEKVYGKEFDGKIEVHHRVPLHEIKKEYIVDPIKDLIPVCPNCHMILHSKKDGTYTVEEVKEKINKNKEKY